MKIWLDDKRPAPDKSWTLATNYHEAYMLFTLHGWPSEVSFDHDLGMADERTGYDFAMFLVDRDLDSGLMPADFKYNVHSANPVGKANIEGLMKSYFAFKGNYKK
jgi:hypothetical protein